MIGSAKEFYELRTSESALEQSRATHESAPEEVWFAVLREYPDMAFWVIHNKTVPLGVLHHLAGHPDPHIRRTVATKRKLDRELFDALSRDGDEYVRGQVALNRKVPGDILERLGRDESEFVADAARERLREAEAR